MVGAKSEIAVAPRGSASSEAVMSAARRDASRPKCLKMRCRSESLAWISWCSQCTSSTYGLPRSLQKTVAPSMPLYAIGLSLPNSATRLISLTVTPHSGLDVPRWIAAPIGALFEGHFNPPRRGIGSGDPEHEIASGLVDGT